MPVILALEGYEFKASQNYSKILLENQNQKNMMAQDLRGQQKEKQKKKKKNGSNRHLSEEV